MRAYINKERETRVTLFDSVAELTERTAERTTFAHGYGDDHCRGRESFIGRRFESMRHAGQQADVLWAEGMEVLENMRRDLASVAMPAPKSRRRTLRWDDANGDEVDFDRLRSGQNFWRATQRQFVAGTATRTIVVQLGALGCIAADDMLWRGAAAIALAEAMEAAGYRVELWGSVTVDDRFISGKPHEFTAVPLKTAADPLDPSTLVNVCSGWFYRTIFWHHATCIGPTDDGMGHTDAPKAWHLDTLSGDADRVLISEVWTYRDAIDLVKRELEKLTH